MKDEVGEHLYECIYVFILVWFMIAVAAAFFNLINQSSCVKKGELDYS